MHRFFNSMMVKFGAIVILAEIFILAGVSFYDNNHVFWVGVIANIIIISPVILLSSYRMQQRMNSLRKSEEAGNPLYYEGTVEDSTQRKQAEEALSQSKNLFQSLIEALPQNIFSKDLEGRFTFANQRYCMTEGKPLTDIIGKTDFDLHPTELAKKISGR